MTIRLTAAQALVRFLIRQWVERDGEEQRFFAGCLGIFGHGNVAGIGQALHEAGDELRYIPARNEQAMVHVAAGYARQKRRLATFACTSSIGPGATNMVTGAADATINRIPVLLLPGDVFATRRQGPVLQQLEARWSQDVSVNDAFRPVSRYWDRINRPEQLVTALPAAMQVLTDQAETGAVTLALPQDVQAEAYDYPEELFARRVWRIPRPVPDPVAVEEAVRLVRGAHRPLIVAGGGVIYADATDALRRLVDATGIPVAVTQAGKGALPSDHPANLGAAGVTGTPGAVAVAREADLVIGVGTRWTDFTTESHTGFANPDVRFVNVNVAALDAHRLSGRSLVGDARATLELLHSGLDGHTVEDGYRDEVAGHVAAWQQEVDRLHGLGNEPLPSQAEVIGAVNAEAGPRDVVVCAAGSMPGELHRLWRVADPLGYHVEYGYSCMGYEIAGGIGVKLADPDREVFVMVGDGSYLMMPGELVTAIQEGVKLVVVLVQNHGFASIGSLSERVGSGGFGTWYRHREPDGSLGDRRLPVDLAANAASLGTAVRKVTSVDELRDALKWARGEEGTAVVHVETDPDVATPGAETWWDVPVAEVSEQPTVQAARRDHEQQLQNVRSYL